MSEFTGILQTTSRVSSKINFQNYKRFNFRDCRRVLIQSLEWGSNSDAVRSLYSRARQPRCTNIPMVGLKCLLSADNHSNNSSTFLGIRNNKAINWENNRNLKNVDRSKQLAVNIKLHSNKHIRADKRPAGVL